MWRIAIAVLCLAVSIADAQVLFSGAQTFNGGRTQTNFWFPSLEKAFPFINHLKLGDTWIYGDNSARPQPDTLDANGYPITVPASGLKSRFDVPTNSEYSGNWVLRWVGTGTMQFASTSFTVVSCNVTCTSNNFAGTNGRVVGTLGAAQTSATVVIALTNGVTPITDVIFVRADEEALYDAGKVFSPFFIQRLAVAKFGVLRNMDWILTNTTNVSIWENRKPMGHYTWAGDEIRASIWGGTTTNSGDAYSLAYPPSQSPVDKTTVTLKWNATASGTSPTLNGIPVKNPYGDVLPSTSVPAVGKYDTLVYDQSLNAWLSFRILAFNDVFLRNGIPIEVFIRLCNEIGAHPWLNIPYLALDPLSNYLSQLLVYTKANLVSGLIPRFEPSNEIWNSALNFYGTRYAWNKANARWGSFFDDANWYGMVSSTVGQAVSAAYGNDRTRYQVISGQQQTNTTAGFVGSRDTRVNSTRWVADGGSAAKNWVTHVAPAGYILPSGTSATALLATILEYSTADTTRKTEIVNTYVDSTNIDCGDSPPCNWTVQANGRQTLNWSTWAAVYGLKTTNYEGGVGYGLLTSNYTSNVSGISKAAHAIVTISTTTASTNPLPPIGAQITFSSSIGGMVEIRGLTGTVLSVAGQNVTVDINSSVFTAYTSGGFVTHVNSMTNFNALSVAARSSPNTKKVEYDHLQTVVNNGAEFPSLYTFSGDNDWASLYKDIYGSFNTSKYDAHVIFNNNGIAP